MTRPIIPDQKQGRVDQPATLPDDPANVNGATHGNADEVGSGQYEPQPCFRRGIASAVQERLLSQPFVRHLLAFAFPTEREHGRMGEGANSSNASPASENDSVMPTASHEVASTKVASNNVASAKSRASQVSGNPVFDEPVMAEWVARNALAHATYGVQGGDARAASQKYLDKLAQEITPQQLKFATFLSANFGVLAPEKNPVVADIISVAQETIRDAGLDPKDYLIIVPDVLGIGTLTHKEDNYIALTRGFLEQLEASDAFNRDVIKFIIGRELVHSQRDDVEVVKGAPDAAAGEGPKPSSDYRMFEDSSPVAEHYKADRYGLQLLDKQESHAASSALAPLHLLRAFETLEKGGASLTLTQPHSHRREAMIYHNIKFNYWRNLSSEFTPMPRGVGPLSESAIRKLDQKIFSDLSFDRLVALIDELRTPQELARLLPTLKLTLAMHHAPLEVPETEAEGLPTREEGAFFDEHTAKTRFQGAVDLVLTQGRLPKASFHHKKLGAEKLAALQMTLQSAGYLDEQLKIIGDIDPKDEKLKACYQPFMDSVSVYGKPEYFIEELKASVMGATFPVGKAFMADNQLTLKSVLSAEQYDRYTALAQERARAMALPSAETDDDLLLASLSQSETLLGYVEPKKYTGERVDSVLDALTSKISAIAPEQNLDRQDANKIALCT